MPHAAAFAAKNYGRKALYAVYDFQEPVIGLHTLRFKVYESSYISFSLAETSRIEVGLTSVVLKASVTLFGPHFSQALPTEQLRAWSRCLVPCITVHAKCIGFVTARVVAQFVCTAKCYYIWS